MTAYNSIEAQTDSSPCIGAGGNVCEFKGCVVANNSLKLGTQVEIESIGICTVMDRLNARYNNQPDRFDYFMGLDIPGALTFGVQKLAYTVLHD